MPVTPDACARRPKAIAATDPDLLCDWGIQIRAERPGLFVCQQDVPGDCQDGRQSRRGGRGLSKLAGYVGGEGGKGRDLSLAIMAPTATHTDETGVGTDRADT